VADHDRRTLRIRPLLESDLGQVTEIEEACFATPWSERTFRNLLRRPDAVLLSAVYDERRVAGYAAVWFVGREAELGDVGVAPNDRRRGIGGELVGAVLGEARARAASASSSRCGKGTEARRVATAAADSRSSDGVADTMRVRRKTLLSCGACWSVDRFLLP